MASKPDYWRVIPPFEYGWKQNCHGIRNFPIEKQNIFVFLFFLFFCSFFFFGVSRQWYNLHLVYNWENVSWCHFCFLFFMLFNENMLKMKNNQKPFCKGSRICAARVLLVRCRAVEKSMIVCALVAFWIPESCVVSCCSLHFNFSAHPCFSQWSFGPSGQASSRGQPMFGPAFALLVPTRADIVLMDRWGTLLHTTNNDMGSWCVIFCQFVVRRLAPCGQRSQNKISFDRLQMASSWTD